MQAHGTCMGVIPADVQHVQTHDAYTHTHIHTERHTTHRHT